ncbi:phosphatidylinositol mannoside acyltransferase [Bombiscardovia coagulans]|uniref:Lauroyl acyltransferase n=1 Tax=Bombiscardovia coagulans TaxID=686666 RepID=A0A261EVP6_9BIFI|nr:phosphatidylinositol mannoside acyltransferase [Bombiscardovia coagulans]OZG50905.1 lauroyl acyltransferase [Bombiscardovia coagulans]
MLSKILVTFVRCSRWIPERLARGLFDIAADVVWFLHLSNVHQLERNLKHVLGDVPEAQLRRTSREALRSYFSYFCEAFTVGARNKEELLARVRPEGSGFPYPALAQLKDGALPIATGHQGNWDYVGFWASHDIGPVTTVAERLADPELLQTFIDIRRELGMHILLTGQSGLMADLVETAKQPGQVIPLLADRDLSRNGVFVRAFDSIIRVAAGPAVMALDAEQPLYTVSMHREPLHAEQRKRAHNAFGYVCQVDGPIDIRPYLQLPREQAVQDLTQAWVDQWSAGIREWPQDWHMMQPIFVEDLDLTRLHHVPGYVRDYIEGHTSQVQCSPKESK